MKALDRAVERFCYKHPRFGIRNLMLYIVGGNVLVFLIWMMDTTGNFLNFLYFSPEKILKGEIWRLVTFVFIPADSSPLWLAISLYFYYFIGSSLENQWGSGRFTIYYVSGMLFNIVFGFIVYFFGYKYTYYAIDAFYINMSLFFAFAAIWPEHRVLLMFFIPVKIKWLAILDAVLFAYSIFANIAAFPMNLLPLMAIFNFLLFCGHSIFSSFFRTRKAYARSAEFKRAAQEAKRNVEQNYRHKCSVCGKTDKDHPELEFRYCSRCAGYHCFCEEHINNHVHFNE